MAGWGYYGGYWPAYVPVAKKIANAKKAAEKLRKKGVDIQPVELSGRKIALSFWGKSWCDHMESYHDFENRLPRGRSYVRNGSVVHLEVAKGVVNALVAGSRTYTVKVKVDLLPRPNWEGLKKRCAGQISSLLDLLKGKLSDGVMRIVTSRDNGLFPGPDDFRMHCSCPDYACMCKHIAAVMYGVGARLDERPELLFLLRGVDHAELAADGGVDAVIARGAADNGQLGDADLSEVFGIELLPSDETPDASQAATSKSGSRSSRKTGAKAAAEPARGKGRPPLSDRMKQPRTSRKEPAKPPATKTPPARARKSAKTVAAEPPRQKPAASAKRKAGPPNKRGTASTRDKNLERLEKALKMVEEYAASKRKGSRSKGKTGTDGI